MIGGLCACTGLGPPTIPRDRFDYNAAISDSWKEQTLLNIVKLRYADMPLFVDVASVVSGYSLESSVSLVGTDSSEGAVQGNSATIGGNATFTDRPTITYAPITGAKFNKSFMTPIPPEAVLFLIQSGWSVDLIFPLVVDSINGQRSELAAGNSQRPGDEAYYRVMELLRGIQRTGATGMQIQDTGARDTALLIFHKEALSEEGEAAVSEIAELLDIRPGLESYRVKYGYLPADDTEIALLTRSMLQIIINLATRIAVPPEHIADGRTVAASETVKQSNLIDVRYSEDDPDSAFVKVRYRDNWYYIDDRDFRSKSVFTFVMLLFSLTESGDHGGLPLVTIPAG
jgi:hypothetical protein